MKKVLSSIAICSFAFSGCSTPEKAYFGGGRVNTASANQMFYNKFEEFDEGALIYLLNPDATIQNNLVSYKDIAKAFQAVNTDKINAKFRRSQIQDRLIAASNQRCNLYKMYLKRVSTYNNGIFGTLTTVLGGAGAIVTKQETSSLLSGLAGISSGTRGELNQAVFESIATSIIIPGIESSRKNLLIEIYNNRDEDIHKYTVERAVADAINYHGACSMDTGINYAQKSIQSYEDIGIKRLNKALLSFETTKVLSNDFSKTSVIISAKGKLNEFKNSLDENKKTELKQKLDNLNEKAKLLDSSLQTILFNYSSNKGLEKEKYLNSLEAKQLEIMKFVQSFDNLK